jgi:hypothetical protein
MPRWLVEDPTTVYFILGLAALGLGVAFWVRQERKYLIGLGIVAALAILVALLDHFIVTDYERMVGHVNDIADAIRKKDSARIVSHVTDTFHYDQQGSGSGARDRFRKVAEPYLLEGGVTDMAVWDFEPGPMPISRADKKAEITFMVKLHGSEAGDKPFRCVSVFVLEPDGEWRIESFRLYTPEKDPKSKDVFHIPVRW